MAGRTKRRDFRTYVAIPFAVASVVSVGMAAFVVFAGLTGFRGKFQPSATPVPLAEAWIDARDLSGLIFVVTFLVLAVWTWIRSRPKRFLSN
jgi:cellobiose-specific phosphotransferase system component IIC